MTNHRKAYEQRRRRRWHWLHWHWRQRREHCTRRTDTTRWCALHSVALSRPVRCLSNREHYSRTVGSRSPTMTMTGCSCATWHATMSKMWQSLALVLVFQPPSLMQTISFNEYPTQEYHTICTPFNSTSIETPIKMFSTTFSLSFTDTCKSKWWIACGICVSDCNRLINNTTGAL